MNAATSAGPNDIWTPAWSKSVRHALIDRDLSITEFALELGLSRGHVNAIINGKLRSLRTQQTITEYLNIA